MNKAHRDRIAFMRICSGKFDASQEVYHVQGDKKMRLLQPQQMMAESRHVVDEAYAGDIIGVCLLYTSSGDMLSYTGVRRNLLQNIR